MSALVVDLSNNNAGAIDYVAMRRAGAFGLLHKVTEGTGFVDPRFADRARAARAAGLHVGGYHFARPAIVHGDAARQAEFFCRELGRVQRRDLHPALDLETNDGHLTPDALFAWAHEFGDRVNELAGVRVLWYTYPGFLQEQAWQHELGNGAGLWLADYGPNDGHDHGVPAGIYSPWRRFVAHQFTSTGTLAGVAGHVDLSRARSRRKMLAYGLHGLR